MATSLSVPGARSVATGSTNDVGVRAAGWNLIGATLVGVALAIFVMGGAWDIQWHVSVGRDRLLTAPHQLILAGIALAGLVSLIWVLGNTWQARRSGPNVEQQRVFGIFYTPVGFVLSGFGALLGAIAFPLDDYWHTLYGIDVTLWSPFHVMIISSLVLTGLGSLTVFASALHAAPHGRQLRTQVGFAATLAVTFATLLVLIVQADAQEGLAQIGGYAFVLYPILLAFALPIALLPAVLVTRLPGAATIVAVVFLALRQIMFWFVPWAVHATVVAEGLAYRSGAPRTVITPFAYPTAILGAALVIDGVYWLMRRRGTSNWLLLGAAWLTAIGATFWDQPWAFTLRRWYFADLRAQSVFLNALPFTVAAAVLGIGMALLVSRALTAPYRGGGDA